MENKSISESLIDGRIIFLKGEITPDTADSVIAQLLYLDSISQEDIHIYINSPGGSVLDGLAIIDTMDFIGSKVNTIAIGMAASMAAVILACGERRYALKHSRMMIHQAYGGVQGTMSDIDISFRNMKECKKALMRLLSAKTGKSITRLEKDCDRDYWFSAEQAKDYGLIDEILTKKPTE